MSSTTFKRSPLRLLFAGALALAIALGLAGSASAATDYYYMVNANSGKVLMPQNHSSAWGTTLVQDTLTGAGAQTWFVEKVDAHTGYDIVRIKNRNSKLCIHPGDWSGLPGTRLLQANCTDNAEAKWQRGTWSDGSNLFTSRKTGRYMDIAGSSTASGATAIQNGWTNAFSQHWRFVYAGSVSSSAGT